MLSWDDGLMVLCQASSKTELRMGNSELGEHLKDLTLTVNEDDPDSDAFLIPCLYLCFAAHPFFVNQNQLFLAIPVSGGGTIRRLFVILITA